MPTNIFKNRIGNALKPEHSFTVASNNKTGWAAIGGNNDLKVAFNNIANRHDEDITAIEKQGRGPQQAEWCQKWEMTLTERHYGGHDGYANQFWYANIASYLFFIYRIALIDLTYYCVNKKKLDFPSQMPSAADGDSSIYRAGKLYSFDGRNQWAVQGKHVNDMCTPSGTKGEPIFFNADLTSTTYSYMGIGSTNCYGIVAKRAIKNIWRTDNTDNDAPINLILKLTTDDNQCPQDSNCKQSARVPRGCKNLSQSLQKHFQRVMILYILTEYCDITDKRYSWRGVSGKSLKDMLFYKINEAIGTVQREGISIEDNVNWEQYDEEVLKTIIDFVNNELLRLQNIIPMIRSVKGYHCDHRRHGPGNRRNLFHVFQAYGDDRYRRSYHYDDRVYVEVQFQILRAMQEVLKRVSRGVETPEYPGMLKDGLRKQLGLNPTALCRIIGTWADYTPRGTREREGGRGQCTPFDLELIVPLKEFDDVHRYKTFKKHNSWTEFYRHSSSAASGYRQIDPRDAYEIINRATGGTFLPDRAGFGIPCIARYPYLTVSGDGRLRLGDPVQGRNPPFNTNQLHQFFPQHHQGPQNFFNFQNNNGWQQQNIFGGFGQQNQGVFRGGDGTNNTDGLGSRIFDEVENDENDENKELLIKSLKLFYKKIKNSNDIVKDITTPSLTIKNSSVDKINTDEVKDYFNSITDEKSISVIIEFIQYHYGIRLVVTKKYMDYMRIKLLNDTLFDLDDNKYTDSEPKNIKEILSKFSVEEEADKETSEPNSKNMIVPKMKTGDYFYTKNKGNIYNVTEPYNSFNQLSAPMMVAGKKRKIRRKKKKTRRKKKKTRRKKKKTRRKVHKKTRRKVNKKKKTHKNKNNKFL